MPTEKSTADYEIGPAQVASVIEKSFHVKTGTRAVRVRLAPDEVLPKEFEGLKPISVRVDDLFGHFIELWYLISDLKRVH